MFFAGSGMGRVLKTTALAFALLVSLKSHSAGAASEYESGTLVAISKNVKITPIDYVYETVVSYYETVTYELQIRVGNEIYFSIYTPDIQPNWPLPQEWRPNAPVQFRRDKHRLIVKVSYDGEVTTFIARHSRMKAP
jgi:hypothetical protein